MTDDLQPAPEDQVVRERRGKVELVRINREYARNAIDGPTTKALDRAFDELTTDDDVWAVVLTGTGSRAFCAGMDLKAFATGQAADILSAKGGFGGLTRRHFPKPLIAAVNGPALAGGCELMLACDLVVAAEHATFGIPEVKRGLVAAGGGLLRLHRRIPYAVALELALTGDAVDARRAYELGLVNKMVPAEQVVEEAVSLAEKICANAPLAVRTSKEIMRLALDLGEDEAWAMNTDHVLPIFASTDAREGAMAFAEKRAPNWQGA